MNGKSQAVERSFNLYSKFRDQFAHKLDSIALVDEAGKSYSYRFLECESARLANFLTQQGVIKGDRVSAQIEKSVEALCLYLACLRAGFVYHPMNPSYQADEVAFFVENARPKIIICDEALLGNFQTCDASLYTLNSNSKGTLLDSLKGIEPKFESVFSHKDEVACLLYSSGTTGLPKGIPLSHGNLLVNSQALVKAWGFTNKDVLLHALPIFHVHGLFVAIGCVLMSGASMRWLSGFKVDSVLEHLPTSTVLMGVPTYYTRLLNDEGLSKELTQNMRLFISGSAPLLEETYRQFEKTTGHRILERYGMTETNMNTSNPLDGERKVGTVGLPLPGVEVRVVDENGRATDGGVGNIQVRGENVFNGYWKESGCEDLLRTDFSEDGFFNTGDLGSIDGEGYLTIVGRSKDMIISGGLNIYPKEIESAIDKLSGVIESAVIGISHDDFGEAVVAIIVKESSSSIDGDLIISELKSKIASYKVPKQVVFVDKLPKNVMGKVQKNTLRDQWGSIGKMITTHF